MSRRRAPVRRWHVGDWCIAAHEVRMGHRDRHVTRTYWRLGVVVAVRGDRLVIQSHGHLYVHPWWELRDAPRQYRAWRFRRPLS
jgi:hypothetical protein